jgi:hypothetical protein
MSRDRLLPAGQKAEVIAAIYADADRQGWRTLSLKDRSRIYSSWVDDPRIGQVLTQYMTPEQARAWIKDGPMKEYGRALRGAGRYASFGRQGGTGPQDVVRHALGVDASVIESSLGTKPLHCLAQVGDAQIYVAWGEGSNFRNLVWAALTASVDGGVPAHVVILEPPGVTTLNDEIRRQRAIAERCGLRVYHMREVLGESGVSP